MAEPVQKNSTLIPKLPPLNDVLKSISNTLDFPKKFFDKSRSASADPAPGTAQPQVAETAAAVAISKFEPEYKFNGTDLVLPFRLPGAIPPLAVKAVAKTVESYLKINLEDKFYGTDDKQLGTAPPPPKSK